MILVTGGTGFIGRYVCSILAAHGKNLIALDANCSTRHPAQLPYLTVQGDITHQASLNQVFQQYPITTIIHLAAVLNTASRQHPRQATKVNILGSLNLLEAARQFHVPKVIYGSSISVYGALSTQYIDESQLLKSPPAPEGVYGTAKRYVEVVGEIYQQQFGIQFVALRIASVIGAGATSPTSLWRSEIFEALQVTDDVEIMIPYQAGEALPLVYVEDVAEMIRSVVDAEHVPLTIYNTPAETWTMQALAEYVNVLAPNIRFRFGESKSGIPAVVSGQQFITDFGYIPSLSIKERLLSFIA